MGDDRLKDIPIPEDASIEESKRIIQENELRAWLREIIEIREQENQNQKTEGGL